jgi:hypothetical protein
VKANKTDVVARKKKEGKNKRKGEEEKRKNKRSPESSHGVMRKFRRM